MSEIAGDGDLYGEIIHPGVGFIHNSSGRDILRTAEELGLQEVDPGDLADESMAFYKIKDAYFPCKVHVLNDGKRSIEMIYDTPMHGNSYQKNHLAGHTKIVDPGEYSKLWIYIDHRSDQHQAALPEGFTSLEVSDYADPTEQFFHVTGYKCIAHCEGDNVRGQALAIENSIRHQSYERFSIEFVNIYAPGDEEKEREVGVRIWVKDRTKG